jgi:hypothetical protein
MYVSTGVYWCQLGNDIAQDTAMTTEETQRAEAWSKMTKKARIAWLRSGNVLNVSSAERQVEKAKLIRKASGT